jgi:hypothetical protein
MEDGKNVVVWARHDHQRPIGLATFGVGLGHALRTTGNKQEVGAKSRIQRPSPGSREFFP